MLLVRFGKYTENKYTTYVLCKRKAYTIVLLIIKHTFVSNTYVIIKSFKILSINIRNNP